MAVEPSEEILAYLTLLHGREPRGALVDLRYRVPGERMRERFRPVEAPARLVAEILALAETADVYVGCAPRRARRGGSEAVARGWVLWADVDSPAAAERLAGFSPPPSLIVASGSPGNVHAYWSLAHPLAPDALRRANRRVVHALGADMAASDAARILRPPGTLNHKHSPPRHVETVEWNPTGLVTARAVVGALTDPPGVRAVAPVREPGRDRRDPLREIPPPVYVAALLGCEPNREGKVPCPFHPDDSPSLHVYRTAERGWFCFGCGAGGSIYDLAARLRGVTPRGRSFLELREWLLDELRRRDAGIDARQARSRSNHEPRSPGLRTGHGALEA
ncbi:MAG: DNA-primase RepB domain-containing protein [Actinomycetota bacterium]